MKQLALILDNVRSANNVGSIFRSADAFGVDEILCCGITPYPKTVNDERLPHVKDRAHAEIAKTALGAEKTVPFRQLLLKDAIAEFNNSGFTIYALEQSASSIPIHEFRPKYPCALIVGNEVTGLSRNTLSLADQVIEIPMAGHKESLNVSVATGVALFYFNSFFTK